MSDNIYLQIKKIRKEKNITLKQMSEMTGLSISFISQVERGISTITLVSLKKITDVLEISMSDLFQNIEEEISFTGKSRSSQIQKLSCYSDYDVLSGKFPGRKLECLTLSLAPKSVSEETSHTGEEFYYVLKGRVTCIVEDKKYVLEEGDTIHFPSNYLHSVLNDGDYEAKMICVISPTIF